MYFYSFEKEFPLTSLMYFLALDIILVIILLTVNSYTLI